MPLFCHLTNVPPYLAAIEPLLEDKKIRIANYKVVYMVENTVIIIARIWDCRQDPEKLVKSLK